jgi:hypothetical protein
LAVIGHVDRTWSYSFQWPGCGPQTAAFEDVIFALTAGAPIGYAMEAFAARYASVSVTLNTLLFKIRNGKRCDDDEVSGLWTATNDARTFILLGDPAVRT